ncbi:hypothetical protein ABZX90_26185 [Streptomyces sp. NPDC002935]
MFAPIVRDVRIYRELRLLVVPDAEGRDGRLNVVKPVAVAHR